MESPIEVVRRFCAAWSDNVGAGELAAFFTDDAVYHNIPLAPVTGREAIAKTISSFIRPGAPGIESIDFRVINIAANGPVVMTERVDVFRLPGCARSRRWGSARSLCCGFVAQRPTGRLNAWRTREASSLAKASLTGACPMIRRKYSGPVSASMSRSASVSRGSSPAAMACWTRSTFMARRGR